MDHAKNARYYHDQMLVQNNAPKITSIVLATDIDGDNEATIEDADKGDEYQKFSSNQFVETGFIVRNNKLKLKVNVSGGTGEKKYFLRYKTLNGEDTANNLSGIFEIEDFPSDTSDTLNPESM